MGIEFLAALIITILAGQLAVLGGIFLRLGSLKEKVDHIDKRVTNLEGVNYV